MEEEIWRDVVGFEKYYQISNQGRVKSLSRTIIRSNIIYTAKEKIFKKSNYVTLSKDGISKQYCITALMKKAFKDDIYLIFNKKENVIKETIKQQLVEIDEIYPKMRETYKVRCITTGKEFDIIDQANEFYDIKAGAITRCCKGERKSARKLKDGTKLVWEYINNVRNEEIKMFNLIKKISDKVLRKEILSSEIWSNEEIDLLNQLKQGRFNINIK